MEDGSRTGAENDCVEDEDEHTRPPGLYILRRNSETLLRFFHRIAAPPREILSRYACCPQKSVQNLPPENQNSAADISKPPPSSTISESISKPPPSSTISESIVDDFRNPDPRYASSSFEEVGAGDLRYSSSSFEEVGVGAGWQPSSFEEVGVGASSSFEEVGVGAPSSFEEVGVGASGGWPPSAGGLGGRGAGYLPSPFQDYSYSPISVVLERGRKRQGPAVSFVGPVGHVQSHATSPRHAASEEETHAAEDGAVSRPTAEDGAAAATAGGLSGTTVVPTAATRTSAGEFRPSGASSATEGKLYEFNVVRPFSPFREQKGVRYRRAGIHRALTEEINTGGKPLGKKQALTACLKDERCMGVQWRSAGKQKGKMEVGDSYLGILRTCPSRQRVGGYGEVCWGWVGGRVGVWNWWVL